MFCDVRGVRFDQSIENVSYKRLSVCGYTSMFRTVLIDFQVYDPYVYDDDISRGVPRERHWRLVCDVITNTPNSPAFHLYAHEWGDQRPWVIEPELEQYPCVVGPIHAGHIHAGGEQPDAETQTPEAQHITEFMLAFCMLNHTRLGDACVCVELPEHLVQMIMDAYAPAFYQLFVS
jgi:hypothetical protein